MESRCEKLWSFADSFSWTYKLVGINEAIWINANSACIWYTKHVITLHYFNFIELYCKHILHIFQPMLLLYSYICIVQGISENIVWWITIQGTETHRVNFVVTCYTILTFSYHKWVFDIDIIAFIVLYYITLLTVMHVI